MPRISCGNHKINLAVKNAIKRHETMRIQIRKLNIWVTKIRKSVELTKFFANSRCRRRLDNETRWGSSFLKLEQIVKAKKRGLLNEILIKSPCPVPLAILKHAYFFHVGLQRQSATIAEMIPSILSCIAIWESMKVKTSENGRILCDYLIEEFKKRFDYELNSHIYQVSIAFNYKFILIKFLR